MLYGLSRQSELPKYFSKEELIEFGEGSSDPNVPVLIEAILYRYYGQDQFESKLIVLMDEFMQNDDSQYYDIQ